MSLIKAVKWLIMYFLLTLGFAGATALAAFWVVANNPHTYEFETLFFFFLFFAGILLVLIGALIIFKVPKGIMRYHSYSYTGDGVNRQTRLLEPPSERRNGIVLILVGLTFILVSLPKFVSLSEIRLLLHSLHACITINKE
jgi:hypothetical protein